MKTTIPAAPPSASPSAGTTQPAGKSSDPDAVLKVKRSASEVTDAKEVAGAARRCIDQQLLNDETPGKWNVRNEANMSSDDNDK